MLIIRHLSYLFYGIQQILSVRFQRNKRGICKFLAIFVELIDCPSYVIK